MSFDREKFLARLDAVFEKFRLEIIERFDELEARLEALDANLERMARGCLPRDDNPDPDHRK
ncbi:MAG: HalX domain-containing protein [Hyphomicrobiaceae bacterium]|nr:HalX domain-containing protein [Hyphomicrobiaceae bacterium]